MKSFKARISSSLTRRAKKLERHSRAERVLGEITVQWGVSEAVLLAFPSVNEQQPKRSPPPWSRSVCSVGSIIHLQWLGSGSTVISLRNHYLLFNIRLNICYLTINICYLTII